MDAVLDGSRDLDLDFLDSFVRWAKDLWKDDGRRLQLSVQERRDLEKALKRAQAVQLNLQQDRAAALQRDAGLGLGLEL